MIFLFFLSHYLKYLQSLAFVLALFCFMLMLRPPRAAGGEERKREEDVDGLQRFRGGFNGDGGF